MSIDTLRRIVRTNESGQGAYGQFIVAGRHVLSADEPEASGGQDTGPDPYELLLSGLAACTAMTIRIYASRKEWPLQHVEVQARYVQRVDSETTVDGFERVIELT